MGADSSRPAGHQSQAGEPYANITAAAPSESEHGTARSSTLGHMRALGMERAAALQERANTFSGPGGAQWADVVEAISASDELNLDPQRVLQALKALESWLLARTDEIVETQRGIHRGMDALDKDSAAVLHELERIATQMRRDAVRIPQSVAKIEAQVEHLCSQLEGMLQTHQQIEEHLENMLPVSETAGGQASPCRTLSSDSAPDATPRR
mmetsp:Transcript_82/g.194  ORF Transcript_82/g.194 Transcript_82/m.194 type:complete len:211 (+) Transcript_82:173-805(+)